MNALAEQLSGASKAEIEAAVETAALLAAYKNEAEVSTEDFLDAIDLCGALDSGVSSVKEFRELKKCLSQPAAKVVSTELRQKAEDFFKIDWK